MTVFIIGVGLIGGSMALALKHKKWADKIIGFDISTVHAAKALELGLIDEIVTIEKGMHEADYIILAIPVDHAVAMLPQILDNVKCHQTIIDAGSAKQEICEMLVNHPNRKRFVATHPMWGTEFSGPQAAEANAFADKAVVICNSEQSAADALQLTENMYQVLGMHLLYMDAVAHDLHAAYVSHISHITSFALANTVLQKEKEENTIFELASAGFASTVRLAKSNPAMWVPIFRQNKENVLDVLNEHITQLRKFKSSLEKENWEYLKELIEEANGIKRILK